MDWSRYKAILLLCAVTQLAGCIAIPFPGEFDHVTPTMKNVEELSARSATAYEVAENFGRPYSYTKDKMHYTVSRDPTSLAIIFPSPAPGLAGLPVDPSVEWYKLTLEFDERDRLRRYELLDWPKRHEKHTMFEYLRQEHPIPEHLPQRAELGDTEAQWQLYATRGSIRMGWEGGHAKWLCSAADEGHADAQRRVAFLYRMGWLGPGKDTVQAYVWYALSAASGNQLSEEDANQLREELSASERVEAESLLSTWEPGLCEEDLPQRRSLKEWLERASGPDSDPEAAYQVWRMIGSDDMEKYKWLCRAADRGHARARARLRALYKSGTFGFKKDLVRAYMWERLTAQKDPSAEKQAPTIRGSIKPSETIRSSLTPSQIAEAERLLSVWKPGQCERDLLSAVAKE